MKIEREPLDNRNSFTGYGEGYVAVNGERRDRSLVVSGEQIAEWAPRSIDALAAADVAPLLELRPEIVLIGTGASFRFPDPAALAPLHAARVGVEVMDTKAACRTYNILLAEGRNVVAAVIV
jgi:uncharacterized protein